MPTLSPVHRVDLLARLANLERFTHSAECTEWQRNELAGEIDQLNRILWPSAYVAPFGPAPSQPYPASMRLLTA